MEFWSILPIPNDFWLIPPLLKEILSIPHSKRNSDQPHPLPNNSIQFHPLPKEIWPIFRIPKGISHGSQGIVTNLVLSWKILINPTHPWRDYDQFLPLLKEFWLILPTVKGIQKNPLHSQRNQRPRSHASKRILITPAHSQRSFDKFHALPKKFWPIMLAPGGTLTNPTHSWKNSDPLLIEFWSIPHAPEGILTNSIPSQWNSDKCCLFLKAFWPIQPAPEQIPTNPSQFPRYYLRYYIVFSIF